MLMWVLTQTNFGLPKNDLKTLTAIKSNKPLICKSKCVLVFMAMTVPPLSRVPPMVSKPGANEEGKINLVLSGLAATQFNRTVAQGESACPTSKGSSVRNRPVLPIGYSQCKKNKSWRITK